MKEYGLAVVSVSDYNNNNPLQSVIDRNGKQSVILTSVAGRIPNKNVLTGTVAESAKIVAGEMCLVQIMEYEEGDPQVLDGRIDLKEYGRTFNYRKLEKVSGLQLDEYRAKLGKAEVEIVATDKKEVPQGLIDERKARQEESVSRRNEREKKAATMVASDFRGVF